MISWQFYLLETTFIFLNLQIINLKLNKISFIELILGVLPLFVMVLEPGYNSGHSSSLEFWCYFQYLKLLYVYSYFVIIDCCVFLLYRLSSPPFVFV